MGCCRATSVTTAVGVCCLIVVGTIGNFGQIIHSTIATALPPSDAKSAADSLDVLLDSFFEIGAFDSSESFSYSTSDSRLTNDEKLERMSACFDLTQTHVTANRHDYAQAAEDASTTKGVREDDAMRLFFRCTVVACYNNMQDADIAAYKGMALREADILRILWRDETTPYDMTHQQSEVLRQVVAKYQEEDAVTSGGGGDGIGWLSLNGAMGMVYFVVMLTVIGAMLFFAVMRLIKAEQSKKDKKSKWKKDKGLQRGASAGAEKKIK